MKNLTVNETLPYSSRDATDIPLLLGKTLAIALLKRQPFFNVSRGNTTIYTFILLVKNAFVCHGISNKMTMRSTLRLSITLLGFRLLWPLMDYDKDLDFTLRSWIIVLYLILGFSPLAANNSFVMSLTLLTSLPFFSPTHSFSEFIVDFFFIANLTRYILGHFWRDFADDIEWLVVEMMQSLVFLALDATLGAQGLVFDFCVISNMCGIYIVNAVMYRKPVLFLLGTIVYVYCLKEKISRHVTRFQIQDGEILKPENMIISGKDLETMALQNFRF